MASLDQPLSLLFQGTWQFISTAQLIAPKRLYGVSDELESFFFVLLYVSLHWIIHNQPDELNVEHIFDQSHIIKTGIHHGGAGKFCMYTMGHDIFLEELEFTESPPLTDLIRQLYCFFESLTHFNLPGRKPRSEDAENVKKLENCDAILRLIGEALAREDWPEVCDKTATDNYPREKETDQKDQVGRAHVKVSIGPSRSLLQGGTSRVSKRTLGEAASSVPKKRSKIHPV